MEIPQLNQLMRELLELSCCHGCPFSSTAAAKCFAGLLNKHPAGTGSLPDEIFKFSPHSFLKRSLLIIHIIGDPRGQSLGQVESELDKALQDRDEGVRQSAVSNLSSCSLQGAVRDHSLLEADNSFQVPAPCALRIAGSRAGVPELRGQSTQPSVIVLFSWLLRELCTEMIYILHC